MEKHEERSGTRSCIFLQAMIRNWDFILRAKESKSILNKIEL